MAAFTHAEEKVAREPVTILVLCMWPGVVLGVALLESKTLEGTDACLQRSNQDVGQICAWGMLVN